MADSRRSISERGSTEAGAHSSMDNLQILHLLLSGLIIPVGGVLVQVAYKVAKIESELNSRIVRLETLMEILLQQRATDNTAHTRAPNSRMEDV